MTSVSLRVFKSLFICFNSQVKRKQKEQVDVENKLNKHNDIINALTEHLKNLRQEVSHTQVPLPVCHCLFNCKVTFTIACL